MLNRRLLRIKTMQSIYAFKQNKLSNKELTLDLVKNEFRDEFLELGQEEKARIDEEQAKVIEYLNTVMDEDQEDMSTEGLDVKLLKIASNAKNHYNNLIASDKRQFQISMVEETEELFTKYLKLLSYLIDISELSNKELQRKLESNARQIEFDQKFTDWFYHNSAFTVLREDNTLNDLLSEHKLRRGEDDERVLEWLRILKRDGELQDAIEEIAKQGDDFETQKEILRVIVRDFLFKNEIIESQFEGEDLNWSENKRILRSMVLKTVKNISTDSGTEILSISKNWDEDKEFFEDLYKYTLEQEESFKEIIAKKSKKWAIDRIAKVDSILINMALAEMLNFRNIPVKVTINEFIEISKQYSTPKSWQFINGMLDSISEELEAEGKIKKSGKGLLDNK
ncbi:transcription antitermination factor NusB [Flammeovirga yaeyamensis]|uniref:Transcription antitermination factor NusB n=3 Tax=Flammeovirgaceae TaxID=200667 RepID=A0AAX1N857_9BACT|nr:transcription antitermination factor NusB [Flammeovirga yaeyamensis]ANQ50489.2 transcription antitermination factor NusB [Flammeovirga sp. MY04]MBB3700669.1 N utilization substance protein B [Flammeovirga yaeyamensis]NMF37781.1 transcription antitermination factor NusB [Flammeovirga yaeyamensis]QWG02088.1 transcription antitermination factor NusB [Flammeovirga yaeyamensis]